MGSILRFSNTNIINQAKFYTHWTFKSSKRRDLQCYPNWFVYVVENSLSKWFLVTSHMDFISPASLFQTVTEGCGPIVFLWTLAQWVCQAASAVGNTSPPSVHITPGSNAGKCHMHCHRWNAPLTLGALAVVDDGKTKLVNASDSTERFKVTALGTRPGWGPGSFWRARRELCSIFRLPLLSLLHSNAREKCKYWNLSKTAVGSGSPRWASGWQFTYLRSERHFWMNPR